MEEHAWLSPVAVLWAIVAVVLASFGIYWLTKRRRGLGWSMVAAGVLMVVIPIGSIVWWDSWGSKAHSLSVQALNPATDPLFTVKINHDAHLISDEYYDTYPFDGAGDITKVVDTFQKQHPNGVATIPATLPTDQQVSLWHESRDDIRFDLVGGEPGDYFYVVTQVASVLRPGEDKVVGRVPYPTVNGGAVLTLDTTIADNVAWAEFTEFYKDIPDVTVGDGTITLPMDNGGTVTLTFDAARETYVATVDD